MDRICGRATTRRKRSCAVRAASLSRSTGAASARCSSLRRDDDQDGRRVVGFCRRLRRRPRPTPGRNARRRCACDRACVLTARAAAATRHNGRMRPTWAVLAVAAAAIVLASAACGTDASPPTPARDASSARADYVKRERASCPQGVLARESVLAPISEVVRAAQRLLARQTIHRQGTDYRLTPRYAPIDYVARISIVGTGTHDQMVPGLLTLHRAGVVACGEGVAQASWAIHYDITVAMAGFGGWRFFVKTTTGWRFWGNWCGASKSRQWRKTNCF